MSDRCKYMAIVCTVSLDPSEYKKNEKKKFTPPLEGSIKQMPNVPVPHFCFFILYFFVLVCVYLITAT